MLAQVKGVSKKIDISQYLTILRQQSAPNATINCFVMANFRPHHSIVRLKNVIKMTNTQTPSNLHSFSNSVFFASVF